MGAQGTTTMNFGAFPGASDASVAVTGQAAIVAGSLVEAWVRPEATADHTADEHLVETIKVIAGNIVAGTGFTVYGFNTNQVIERPDLVRHYSSLRPGLGTGSFNASTQSDNYGTDNENKGTRIYGLWTIAWVWN